MKKHKIADIRKFIADVRQYVLGQNAVQVEGYVGVEKFVIETAKNKLYVSLEVDAEAHKHLYSVFMRFETPCEGMQNPYSGKHNFHETGDVDWGLKSFEYHLKKAVQNFL